MIISFDVGGTFVKHALFNQIGEMLHSGKIPTVIDTQEQFLASLAAIVRQYEEKGTIQGIGFSFPGVIDGEKGMPILSGAIKPFKGQPFVQLMSAYLNNKYPITIENDGNTAALAELYAGNGQNCDSFALLTLGTGIGGGLIQAGELLRGSRFSAGEFGMMLTETPQGKKEILAKYASTQGLLNLYRKRMSLTPDFPVTGEEIFEADTPEKKQVLTQWSEYVAMVIYNVVVTLNPDKIIIGGGVSQNPLLLSLITTAIEGYPEWALFKTNILPCHFLNDAGLVGAYFLAAKQFRINNL